jgi:RNA polymerase sigma-70 factor (ECF subfamily)
MSSSATRYFPSVAGRTESSATKVQDLTSSPIRGGESATQSKPSSNFVQDTENISTPSLSDEDLMSLICDGNKEALASLFRRYARIVRGVAYRVLRDASEADDLLQDVFLLVHRLCGTFDNSKGSARFWILQMTYRRAISRRRYLTSRHFYSHVDLDEAANRLSDQATTCDRDTDSADNALQRKEALEIWSEGLSESQRQTLHLFFFEGYTFDEIAAKLGQTVGNARNHYYRGLDKLRKQISAGKLPGKEAIW